jgi:hypothetical protein
MKRKLLTTIIPSLLMFACGNKDGQTMPQAPMQRQLVEFVYDISKSDDAYAILTNANLEKTYEGMGQNGGGNFYGLHVQTNSLKQDPIAVEVAPLQQLILRGNSYQRANRQRKNDEMMATFESGKDAFVKTASEKLILPKNHDFSDVKNALDMARQISENPIYDSYIKSIVIISDLENDMPPKQGIDKMQPVLFKKGINILVVRPSAKVNLSELMPGSKYTVYTTIDDAINSVFHQLSNFKSHD